MVDVLYNEYTGSDEFERNLEIEFMKESVALDRTLLILHTIEESAAIRAREAEIRCIEESGNIDVLEGYYREAAEEAEDKEQGIVQKVWELIKQMFKNLKEFLVGSKQAKKLREDAAKNVEYGLDDEGEETLSYLKKITNAIHGGEGSLKALLTDKKTWAILVGGGALAGGAVALNVAKNKHKAGELNGIMETIMKILDSGVDKLKSSITAIGGFLKGKAEDYAKKFVNFLGKAKDWILKIVGKFTGGSSEGEENTEGEGTPEKKDDGNPNKRLDDLEGPEKSEFLRKKDALKKKYNGNITKAYRKDYQALLKEYGLVKEYVDEDIEDDFFEESVDNDDVFDIPDFLAEESVSEIDEISELLENL